ncbi:MAG TPA: ATP-binding protein [Polyangiaceae bacterium]|jgi:PAS domain S-box-containing protein|nr:ATP-binding protein [Polyangiaceae bacterium]HNZ21022.1 ATP-binding protein [Polyangiaceae bacterium]HOD24441.1 ATP-binding protein [Polyangiaceae bacterium]HOE51200.1 ATP-binding protein [Polyangiaceae bacterium]HOG98892.1 ATP-binding protein [Polyangiaceae bacterium]
MKIFYKISAILLVAFLFPLLLLGMTGYLSVREIGDRTTETTTEVLLRTERMHLQKRASAEALELDNLCSSFENGVKHLRSHYQVLHRHRERYDVDKLPRAYTGVDTAGLAGFGYVHPVYGAYADFDGKIPGAPWVPRPVVRKLRHDPALRTSIEASLESVMLFDMHLQLAIELQEISADLAWIVLTNGVTNVRPEYDYNRIIAKNPSILDLDESTEDYVRLVDAEHNPERKLLWIEPYFDQFKNTWMTSCVAPLYDGDRFLGSVGMDVLLSVIANQFIAGQEADGYAFLVSKAGKVLAISKDGIEDIAWDSAHRKALMQTFLNGRELPWTEEMVESYGSTTLDKSPEHDLREIVGAMKNGQTDIRNIRLSGQQKLIAFAPVRATGWSLAIVVPEQAVASRANEVQTAFSQGIQTTVVRYSMTSLVVLFVSIAVGLILHYYAVRPLNQLSRRVEAVRWDNLRLSKDPKPRDDEIGHLYAKFHEMLDVLRSARNETVGKAEEIQRINAKLEIANQDLARELDERVLVEQSLSREKELLAVTLRSIGDGVITADRLGRVVLMNRQAEQLTGWTQAEAEGLALDEVFVVRDENDQPCNVLARTLRTDEQEIGSFEVFLQARDGSKRLISDSGAPIRDRDGVEVGVVIVFRDVSVRKRLEEEMIRSQKLESVKLLAAGIAHDFNNLLTAILGNISLSKRDPALSDRTRERLQDAEKASDRARGLTQQLLTFSSGGAPIRGPVDMARLVEESAAFALRGSNVALETSFAPDLQPVFADRGQIAQVIQNLVINAYQAMPTGGTVRITVDNTIVKPEDALPLQPGAYVRVSVKDDGIGISPENLRGVFEPFFSTKSYGNGLGLAVCFSILKRHGGHIVIDSELGVGTECRFYVPVATEALKPKQGETATPPRGTGRILVMDDEPMIRQLAENMLTSLGYEVETACDGIDALQKIEQLAAKGKPFDAVVLDLTVQGGVGGQEIISKLSERYPTLPAIVSSGYSNDPVMADFASYGFRGAIPKPYNLRAMAETLAMVLSANDDKVS